jgi:deoxyadenosine/deoxycytidine kinase
LELGIYHPWCYHGGVKGGRYIAVEGPIGVGKTTLARALGTEFDSRVVFEQVEENPFLRRFYEEPRTYAFQAQLFFLLSRYRQQRQLAQQDLFNQSTVADYSVLKRPHAFARSISTATNSGSTANCSICSTPACQSPIW